MSEIYILSKDFDHQNINPLTQKMEAPIIVFDQLIAGQYKNRDQTITTTEKKSNIPENEDFEYALYKEQLIYFKKHFPKNANFTKLTVPMLGIVLTVPKYDMEGNFNGAVSAVLRSEVIKSFLPVGNFGLINLNYENKIISSPSQDWLDSAQLFKHGFKNSNLIYSKITPIKTMDQNGWSLWVAIPNSVFYKSENYKNTIGHFYIELLFCLFIVICFYYLQLKIFKYDEKLSNKDRDFGLQKIKLEKDNMLLNVLSHDVANTLLAIKSCNDYLSENQKKLYEINTIAKTEETVYKMMIATDLAINVFEHVKEIKTQNNDLTKVKLKLVPTHIDDIFTIALIVFEKNLFKILEWVYLTKLPENFLKKNISGKHERNEQRIMDTDNKC